MGFDGQQRAILVREAPPAQVTAAPAGTAATRVFDPARIYAERSADVATLYAVVGSVTSLGRRVTLVG